MVPLVAGLTNPQVQTALKKFDCGSEEWSRKLNVYIRKYAQRDEEASVAGTHLALEDNDELIGYTTLSWLRVKKTGPAAERPRIEGLPYPDLPALFLMFFAIARTKQGRQQGYSDSVMDWVEDVAQASLVPVRFIALHTDDANSRAIRFYERRQFFVADHDETKHHVLMLRDLLDE